MATATTFPLLGRFLGGLVLGLVGWVFGLLLVATNVFPQASWANILLFLGFVVGIFKDELKDYFGA